MISCKELRRIAEQTARDLAKEFGFKKTISLAHDMLLNQENDEALQAYSTNLLEELRAIYPEEWNMNWKYDAFLGYAYDLMLKYDERYSSYKRAFDKVKPVPPELLVAIAGCCWAPGNPPITEEEAITLVKQAIRSVKYVEAVALLKGLYKSIGNVNDEQYWGEILDDIKDEGRHLPSLDII